MSTLTREQIVGGLLLRVIAEGWCEAVGTIGKVDSVGHVGVLQVWCFTVEWLNRADQHLRHRRHSLHLFEHDLPHLDVYTGLIEQPDRESKRRRVMIPRPPTEQLCLPYGYDDAIPERPAHRYFCLRSRPAWDFDVDL